MVYLFNYVIVVTNFYFDYTLGKIRIKLYYGMVWKSTRLLFIILSFVHSLGIESQVISHP